uniref:Uncharacterized protein n=1 Tax=Anguilla anguilla TaxID=7936 RepID=A0A0E9UBX0_ANGAN
MLQIWEGYKIYSESGPRPRLHPDRLDSKQT